MVDKTALIVLWLQLLLLILNIIICRGMWHTVVNRRSTLFYLPLEQNFQEKQPIITTTLPHHLSISLSSFLPSFLPSNLPSFIPSFLPSFLSSFLPFFLSSFLPSFVSSFLPSFLSSFVRSFLHAFDRAKRINIFTDERYRCHKLCLRSSMRRGTKDPRAKLKGNSQGP